MDGASGDGHAAVQPVFQSRLRAKREERLQQRQLQHEHEHEQLRAPSAGTAHAHAHAHASPSLNVDLNELTRSKLGGLLGSKSSRPSSHRSMRSSVTIAESPEDTAKRRQRAEARRLVMDYNGSVWDAVCGNDLAMLQNYFLVEGAHNLLRHRHPDAEHGGRSLLHCAAWYGHKPILEFLLSVGCDVDTIDSVPSKTTALIEAARAGHADICVALLRHGADPRHRDYHGDTAFHWAGRRGHGTVLLQMALELEQLKAGSSSAIWAIKNHKFRTVLDLVQANAFIIPLLQKRLGRPFTRALESAAGKRRSRFPSRAAGIRGTLLRANSRVGRMSDSGSSSQLVEPVGSSRAITPPALSGVQELGLDVSSFAYRSRDSLAFK